MKRSEGKGLSDCCSCWIVRRANGEAPESRCSLNLTSGSKESRTWSILHNLQMNSTQRTTHSPSSVRSELNRNLGGFWTLFCLLIRGRLKFHLRESWGPADGWMKRSFHAAAFKGISSQRAQNLVFTVWAFETVQHWWVLSVKDRGPPNFEGVRVLLQPQL